MPAIHISGVGMQYPRDGKDIIALEDATFDVKEGEIVSVVGPSGCGKSTLLLVIAGLRTQTRGQVRIGSLTVNAVPNVGMVFQEYDKALMPWLSVLKNVELGLRLRRLPPPDRRRLAVDALRRVGLNGSENAYPHELSGGMRQRVQIARILAYNPDFLLLDEPFGSLDAQTKRILQREFLALWEQKPKSVILVTHDVSEAVYLSDRVLIMSKRPGRIILDIRVKLSRPRGDLETLEDTDAFLRTRRIIANHLKDQVERSPIV
jgi:NitT/TauT family transport system ATP-binding protein